MAISTGAIPITLNRVYKWTFPSRFATLNGVYLVSDIQTFTNALASGVDLVKYLYTPAGLTQTDYAADAAGYANSLVYKLTSPTDSTSYIYVPDSLLTVNPDPTVSRFQNVYLTAPIGVFANSSSYSYILSQVDDFVASVTGKTGTTRFMARPAADVWMTEDEYVAMDATRQAAIQTTSSLSAQLLAYQRQIDLLKAKITALEEIIRTHAMTNGT